MKIFLFVIVIILYLIGVIMKWYIVVSNSQPLETSNFERKYPILSSSLPWNIPMGIWFLIALCSGIIKYID